MPEDSTGRPIQEGDRVRFRGKEYTIKAFLNLGAGRCGTYQIEFVEPVHTDEIPDEIGVDII